MSETFAKIFRKGSRTYFYSSVFFPKSVRDDVFKLYSFVRVADDYVDTVPQKVDEFYAFKGKYERAVNGERTGNIIIDSFADLMDRKGFEKAWVDSFLASMEADIHVSTYPTIERLRTYLYGSAEVIGLMMAKVIGLPARSYGAAMLLGRAMQYVNFIRDISEDLALGRSYFPSKEMEECGLVSLQPEYTSRNPSGFGRFVGRQLDRYQEWQEEGERGFGYIPKRFLIPIKTASEMYKWTAEVIRRNPMIIYALKVKPSVPRVISRIGYNALFA